MLNLDVLNPPQRQAVETTDGPVLVLAGAGSGKTRVITYRIAYLIEKGVPPEAILAVTFTNKAAREMRERVRQLTTRLKLQPDGRSNGPTICTFHSLGARILRRHIELLGYKRNFVIYNESEQLGAVKKILSRLHLRGEKADPAAVLAALSWFKNHSAQPGWRDDASHAAARQICEQYNAALHACNAVDFDDLLLLPLRLFREHPDILHRLQQQYQYVMVDEYQDTNGVQLELLRMLTARHHNLCVVGDDDQSIYGWRGAEIANLLEMEKHFPQVKIIKLEQNYRSTNNILEAANAVIRHNPRRRPKKLWSTHGAGEKIALYTFENDEEEARTVVEHIESNRLFNRIPWRAHAVLFRTNQQSRLLEAELRKARVRYHLVGGQSYFDRREVRDFLAYLKVMANPHDEISLLRIANVPARGLSETTMQHFLAESQKRHCSVYTAMRNPDVQAGLSARAGQATLDFLSFLDAEHGRLSAAKNAFSLKQWAEKWLDAIGYWNELKRSEKNPDTAQNRIQNLRELVEMLDKVEPQHGPAIERVNNFLEEITLDTEREAEDDPGDAVTLITMHSCKGLEFPHVFIVGFEEGLLPHSRAIAENSIEEERRLFYVAITRARQTLAMSYCLARKKYGSLVPCNPSRFLKDIPARLIENASEKASRPVSREDAKDLFAKMRAALGMPSGSKDGA